MRDTYQSWGRYPAEPQRAVRPARAELKGAGHNVLPFGNGLSYGDSCLNGTGSLLDTARLDRIVSFDAATGRLRAEAGVTLARILAHAMPQGWFLPVTPGTKHVTLGGAIANDVHGKNHHRRGTFGRHVVSLDLVRSTGERLTCTPADNAPLFAATIGGLGLTGLIAEAEISLIPITSGLIDQETIRFGRLAEFLALAEHSDRGFEYSVAWIDQLARGPDLGRGLFIRGNHASAGSLTPPPMSPRLTVPFAPPVSMISRPTLSAFNALYWRQQKMGLKASRVGTDPFFYPLDKIGAWNRLYGPRGLLQHQCALPMSAGLDAVAEMLRASQQAGEASFLTVLKVFGDVPSPGLMSFPRPGLTLTLDYANSGASTLKLLDRLDEIVLSAGGAINPYKDARMSPRAFEASFPRWRELEAHRDPAFSSTFWRRVTRGP